jgi:Tat protein secretion system quality control protein TatD with DNase activity
VALEVARLKGVSLAEVQARTTANARRLFGR